MTCKFSIRNDVKSECHNQTDTLISTRLMMQGVIMQWNIVDTDSCGIIQILFIYQFSQSFHK